MITHRCRTCDEPVHVTLVDTSTMLDHAHGRSTFLWGGQEKCKGCGSTEEPALVVDDTDLLTQPFDNGVWPR